ncbi:hypothetical protein JTB14_014793 [Gonioctena quinquepunctata]|nr:hypothetical protein JTB14_014793 [Gonioctena quinquepunctata]
MWQNSPEPMKVRVKVNVGHTKKNEGETDSSVCYARPTIHLHWPPPLALKKGSVGQTLADWTEMAIRAPLRGIIKTPVQLSAAKAGQTKALPSKEKAPEPSTKRKRTPAPHPMIPYVWLSDHAPIPNKWDSVQPVREGTRRQHPKSWLSPGRSNPTWPLLGNS